MHNSLSQRHLKILSTVLLVLICSGCMHEHNQRRANLAYSHAVPGEHTYNDLYFYSNLDLNHVHAYLEGRNKIGQQLICSLEKDVVFAQDHEMSI